MASENAFKKRGYHLFKVQDTTKNVLQKNA